MQWLLVIRKQHFRCSRWNVFFCCAIVYIEKGTIFLHSFLQEFPPTKFESKIMSFPYCFLSLKFQSLVPPFLWFPHWFIIFKFPPPKIFNLCITGLHKLTTNTLSTCIISCNTQVQKQVEANLYFKYTNKHIQFTVIYPTSANS